MQWRSAENSCQGRKVGKLPLIPGYMIQLNKQCSYLGQGPIESSRGRTVCKLPTPHFQNSSLVSTGRILTGPQATGTSLNRRLSIDLRQS